MKISAIEKIMGLALVAIALSFATIAPGLGQNVAYANNRDANVDFEKITPQSLDNAKLEAAKQIALDDPRVKEFTAGKSKIEFMSQNFVGNIYDDPVVWKPEVRFNVDDEMQVVAVVDPETGKVTDVTTGPMVILAADDGERSFAIDYYTGSSTITGLAMEARAQSYTPTSADTFTALLVNAIMSGSSSNLCTAASWPTTAWFQAGMIYLPTTGYGVSGAKIGWTNTNFACAAQITNISYISGDDYRFRIYSDSTNGNWVIYMYNIDKGNASTVIVIGPSTYTIKKNDVNTSIFFENTNTNTTWENQFGGDISQVYKYKRNSGSSSWTNWDANTQKEFQICAGLQTDTVISPNSGHPVTFDLSELADDYPAEHPDDC
jgi:hypothetical protein